MQTSEYKCPILEQTFCKQNNNLVKKYWGDSFRQKLSKPSIADNVKGKLPMREKHLTFGTCGISTSLQRMQRTQLTEMAEETQQKGFFNVVVQSFTASLY